MEPQTQAKQAREQLASQGLLAVRPSSREKGIAAIGQRPKSASLGYGRRKRKLTRRRKNRKVTRRRL